MCTIRNTHTQTKDGNQYGHTLCRFLSSKIIRDSSSVPNEETSGP